METAVKPNLKLKTSCRSKNCIPLKEKEINVIGFKFYQKLFVVLITFFTFLIFPESPRDLENICQNYNSSKLCVVW